MGIDLIEHPTAREELLLHARPPTEIGDGCEIHHRVLLGELLRNLRIPGTVEVAGNDLLAFLAVEVLKISGRKWPPGVLQGVLVDYSDGRLREDADRRVDDCEAIPRLLTDGQQRLVLPSNQHVPETMLDERRRRSARAGIQHGDVSEKVVEVLLGAGLIASGLFQ